MKKTRIGIIGGTGLNTPFNNETKIRVGTPYGPSPTITIGSFNGKKSVAYLPRHGEKHSFPPHIINYRANMWALNSLGVERIFATNAVGAININYEVGDVVVPKDFIDFTRSRISTFYNEAPVTHIDLSIPYCPQLRKLLLDAAKKKAVKVWNDSVYLCTEGPRYETPAEIRMFRMLGCDIVGMTSLPELVLARELEMCYASICFITNMAAGLQDHLSAELIEEYGRKLECTVKDILKKVTKNIFSKKTCSCSRTLEGTRF